VLYLWLIILLVRGDVLIDSEALLLIDFVNLNIKSAQSFRCAHRGRICICVFIWVSTYVYEYLCLYCVFLKKIGCLNAVFPTLLKGLDNKVSFILKNKSDFLLYY
jgi:hypothetical protein